MKNNVILLINSSQPTLEATLKITEATYEYRQEFHRSLAKELLGFLDKILHENTMEFSDISGIGVFEGPGSFTGIRIGLVVANTLADSLQVPIVGARDESWKVSCITKLANGEDAKIVLPFYGSDAHITHPRK